MPGKTNVQALSSQWRQHIEDWSQSGLSQQAFVETKA